VRILLSLALVALAACSSTQAGDGDPELSDVVGDWNSTLQARANSGVTGTARAQAVAAATAITVNISGATPNAHHPCS